MAIVLSCLIFLTFPQVFTFSCVSRCSVFLQKTCSFVFLLPDLQLFYILSELTFKSCFLSLLRSPKSCIWVDILPAKQLFHDSHCCKGLIHSIRNCISPSSTYISKSAGWRLSDSFIIKQDLTTMYTTTSEKVTQNTPQGS